MRFLIVASIFACAAAAPSAPLAYSNGILAYGALPVASPLLPVNTGDLQGAAIEANAKAVDNVRAAVDAVRGFNDQAAEAHGEAINAAEDNAWKAVNAVQVATAKIDGAAASVSPDAARALSRSAIVAPIAYSAPAIASPAFAAYSAPGIAAYSAPAIGAYSAPALAAYSTPLIARHSLAVQQLATPFLARGLIA